MHSKLTFIFFISLQEFSKWVRENEQEFKKVEEQYVKNCVLRKKK